MREPAAQQNICDLICLSHLRWNFVFQRPQHLMTRFARTRRVFFVEEPIFCATDQPELRLSCDQGVYVCVPHLPEGLPAAAATSKLQCLLNELQATHRIDRPILWYYTPMALPYTRHIASSAIVFDCMDELSAFRGAPLELVDRERELLKRADLIFTGGHSLYEAKRERHRRVFAFPSSVDVGHFAAARLNTAEPDDQRAIPHPRLGFFGVVDERMDLELLAAIAQAKPEWNLVILGPCVKIDPASLPSGSNIHYLGMKTYAELPAYLSGWDVALLPFALNESTRFISPTKTPEYLAAGCPVVSTPVRDVVRPYGERGYVAIGHTPRQFIAAIELALSGQTSEWRAEVDRFLSQMSWDRTWSEMSHLIDSVASDRTLKTIGDSRCLITSLLEPDSQEVSWPSVSQRMPERPVLVIDKRNHIGGNAYDHYDEAGVLVHKYGPHIFHTNSRDVFEYLSRFTEWRQYQHRVQASVDGQLLPIPINLETVNRLYGVNLTAFELPAFFERISEKRPDIKTSEDVIVSKVGRELYEKFFRNYTRKQWDLDPSELDAAVTARVPVRTNNDDRYFTDIYQAMPKHGYTRLFERLLAHRNIKVMLNADYRELQKAIPHKEVIYTGPVDEYFDYRYGRLPYRSLHFKFETHDTPRFQPAAVINYPNENLYTRVTEFKYLTGQEHHKTSVVYEYPQVNGDPYYPIPRSENTELYRKYQMLAAATENVQFVGRLATYKYYNMDQVVAQALTLYSKITSQSRRDALAHGA